MPASASRSSGAPLASRFTFTPALALARPQPPPWPQPCGIDTTPRMIASVTSTTVSLTPATISGQETAQMPA